ncbi:MAG: hypothetical protein HY868_24870 [Chloroflexi bacterium]|nr:hypothetical protein [Chloroflexota bacterium]
MMLKTGKVIGALAVVLAIALWTSLIFVNPFGETGITDQTWLVSGAMILLCIVGLGGVISARPLLVALVAVLSFLPIGVYMLGVPSFYRLIGVSNLTLLLAGLLMWIGAQSRAR